MTAPATLPAPAEVDSDKHVYHFYHGECGPDVAWCGQDLTGVPEGHATAEDSPCPLCLLANETQTWVCCGQLGGAQ